MRKENDIDFVSLLQNETFLNLVKDTNGSVNQLDVLDKEFPGRREAIVYAVGSTLEDGAYYQTSLGKS